MGWLWVLFEVILRFFVSSNLMGVLFEETIGWLGLILELSTQKKRKEKK